MKVLKFWWTSVWSSQMIKETARIIVNSKKDSEIVVVVSAMTQITNQLIEIYNLTLVWDIDKVLELFNKIKQRHLETALELWASTLDNEYYTKLNTELTNLENILKWVTIIKNDNDLTKARILFFWEILSSILVSLAINNLWIKSNNYYSKDLLSCNGDYLNGECDFDKSEYLMSSWIKTIDLKKEIPVLTWFGWWDENWNVYLFDRWWSDYVWSLVWRFLDVDWIEIWTDVNWIMSADPRIVENPILWEELDYWVCAEFALVWAKVLHPKTISPAHKKFIPVYIKNTFNPEAKWTKICKKADTWLKWITIDDNQVMLNFVDSTMIWWYGYIYDVVTILNDEKISIDSIATTETSFSITIKSKYYSKELYDKFSHLKENFEINIFKNITKVSFVWDTIENYNLSSYFEDEIIMLTGWAYWKSFTVYVKTWDSKKLLIDLHKKVFWK